jgi:hypothetical protein
MNVDFGIISKTRIIDYKYFKYSKLVLSRPFSARKLSTRFLVWYSRFVNIHTAVKRIFGLACSTMLVVLDYSRITVFVRVFDCTD